MNVRPTKHSATAQPEIGCSTDRSGRSDPQYVLKEIATYLAMTRAPGGPLKRSIPGKSLLIQVDAAGALCVSNLVTGRVLARSAPGDMTRLAKDFKPTPKPQP